jgi:hypothetical protein
VDFEHTLSQVVADPRYQKNIEYGQPRSGHPEGRVRSHILQLEGNLELLKPRLIDPQDYWKLKFLIHVHDTFKADAIPNVPISDPRSHASLARAFAAEFTTNTDILNMIQYHDENYALYQQFRRDGRYDSQRFKTLLSVIRDWDLFLIFTIIDGWTVGKDLDKVRWFIEEVRQHRPTRVDSSWIPG